jgi:hypothetical protein
MIKSPKLPFLVLCSLVYFWSGAVLAQSAFNQKEFNCGGENAIGYSTCNDFVRSYATNSFNYAVYGSSAYTLDSVTLEARIPGRDWTKLYRHTSNVSDKHGVIFTFNLAYITEQLSTGAKYLRDNSGFEVRTKVEAVAAGGSSTRHNCAAVDVTYDKGGSNEIWRYRKSGSSASYVPAAAGNVFMWNSEGTSNKVRCQVRTEK